MQKKQSTKSGAKRIARIALFTALTAACAQISIPLPGGVPITLQTLAVMLAAAILRWDGVFVLAAYLFLGLVGVPVFPYGRIPRRISSDGGGDRCDLQIFRSACGGKRTAACGGRDGSGRKAGKGKKTPRTVAYFYRYMYRFVCRYGGVLCVRHGMVHRAQRVQRHGKNGGLRPFRLRRAVYRSRSFKDRACFLSYFRCLHAFEKSAEIKVKSRKRPSPTNLRRRRFF